MYGSFNLRDMGFLMPDHGRESAPLFFLKKKIRGIPSRGNMTDVFKSVYPKNRVVMEKQSLVCVFLPAGRTFTRGESNQVFEI